MYKVYILRSEVDGRYYVGMTEDARKRLAEHNKGKSKSTKWYRPWLMIELETYETRREARNREKYLKSGTGKEYIKAKWGKTYTNR